MTTQTNRIPATDLAAGMTIVVHVRGLGDTTKTVASVSSNPLQTRVTFTDAPGQTYLRYDFVQVAA